MAADSFSSPALPLLQNCIYKDIDASSENIETLWRLLDIRKIATHPKESKNCFRLPNFNAKPSSFKDHWATLGRNVVKNGVKQGNIMVKTHN